MGLRVQVFASGRSKCRGILWSCAFVDLVSWVGVLSRVSEFLPCIVCCACYARLRHLRVVSAFCFRRNMSTFSSGVLTVFMSFLPTVLMLVFKAFFKLDSWQWSQHKLQVFYFWFQVARSTQFDIWQANLATDEASKESVNLSTLSSLTSVHAVTSRICHQNVEPVLLYRKSIPSTSGVRSRREARMMCRKVTLSNVR